MGHETDFTIADFVADLRAPTPSAAAELAVPSAEELLERLEDLNGRMRNAAKKALENRRLLLKLYSDKQVLRAPLIKVNEKEMYLDHLSKLLENAARAVLAEKKQQLEPKVSRLDALSPLGTLKRGYAIAKKENGDVIRSTKQLDTGESFTVTVGDGEISAIAK